MEFTLLAAAAFAVGAFWLMLRWEAKRGNAAGCALDLWEAGLTAGMAGLLVGRLAAMVLAGISPLTNPAQILLVRSGVSPVAATITAIVVFAFFARRDLVPAFDAITPAALAGLAGWHAGCLPTNACLGTESSLPWAWALEGSDVTRHPVELYAAILFTAAAVALAMWKQHGRPPLGVVTGLGIAAAGGIRLVTEPMRVSLVGGPVWFYATGVILGLATGVAAWRQAKRP